MIQQTSSKVSDLMATQGLKVQGTNAQGTNSQGTGSQGTNGQGTEAKGADEETTKLPPSGAEWNNVMLASASFAAKIRPA